MENSFKRFLSMVLVVLMVFGTLPTNAFAMGNRVVYFEGEVDGGEETGGDAIDAQSETDDVIDTEAELAAALAAGGEVVLGGNIEVATMIALPAGVTATLDLNGCAITSGYQTDNTKHIYPLDVYGALTIKDSKGNGSITGRGIYVQSGCKLIIEAGSIYGIDSNGGSALYMYGGEVIIKGGHIEQKASGTSNFAINAAGGTVLVEGGWIGGNHGAIAAVGATVTIYDGEFVCTGTAGMTDNVLYTDGEGSIVIHDGTFTADSDAPAGGCCVYDANGGATINGGNFSKSSGGDVWGTTGTTINGGTFENLTETKHVAVGATIVNGGKTYTKAEDGTMEEVATPVATVNDVEYTSLQEALDAAAAGTGNVTVEILTDVDLTGTTWTPVTVSASGYPVVTVNGNKKTITGLTDMLFAGTWAGDSGLIINDLTIADSAIVNDENDANGNVGVGAFVGFPQASATITLNNCHLVNSTVKGGHWTGGLIGMAGGYNGDDGPVFMNLTITGCSVTGSTITGKGSAGGIIGHGSCAAWTNVVIENTTVSGNTITSTGSSTNKAGSVMGTIGAAGQPTTANGETKTGGASVSATVSGNTVKSADKTITTIYGRQGTETGLLVVAGGSYDSYPIEEGVAYAAPAEGYKIVENSDGTYGLVEAFVEVDTYEELIAALAEKNAKVRMTADITATATQSSGYGKAGIVVDAGDVLDGNGNKLTINGANATWDCAIAMRGGEVRNLTIAGAMRGIFMPGANGDVVIDNCIFKDVIYTFNSDAGSKDYTVTIKDTVLNGWTSFSAVHKSVTFKDCKFGEGSGYAYCRPYQAVVFEGCEFAESYDIDARQTNDIAFEDCTYNGEALTTANGSALFSSGGTVTIDGETVKYGPHVASVGDKSYATLAEALAAIKKDSTLELLQNIEISEPIKVEANLTINGNDHKLTYTGSDRAIDVPNTANGANLTVKDLTIEFTSGYSQRGINYNTNGTLVLNNVTVKGGDDVTYAVNLPSSSTGATVEINDSDITGLIALNVWGANAKVTATNTDFTSVDDASHENYAAVKLNNNGTDAAEGAVITITGGSITALDENNAPSSAVTNSTLTGKINISDTTVVTGNVVEYFAVVLYDGANEFYGCSTLQSAVDKAANDPKATVKLIKNIELTEAVVVKGAVVMDLNGKTVTSGVSTIVVDGGNLTVIDETNKGKIVTTDATGSGEAIAVKNGGNLTLNGGAVESGAYGIYVYTSGGSVTMNGGSVTVSGENEDGMTIAVGSASGSATINGGTIAANGVNYPMYAWDGTISITGGTFDFAPSAYYIADGYGSSKAATEGWYTVVKIDPVAYIGTTGYYSIEAAIEAANEGDTITVKSFTHSGDLLINKKVTLAADEGAAVQINGQLQIKADGVAVKGLKVNCGGTAVQINAKDVLIDGCEIVGSNGLYQSYTTGTVTFKNSKIVGATYGVHFDGSKDGNIVIDNCEISGWTSFASTITKVTIKDSKFVDGNYNLLRFYQDAEVTNTTFPAGMRIDSGDGGTGMADIDMKFNDCSMADGSDLETCFPDSVIVASDVYVDGVKLARVAKIGDTYYETIDKAIDAAKAGDTVTLLANVKASDIIVIDKAITLDGNAKTLTSTASRAINVNGADGVTIKNLTINATGERAINIIQNATNVTIDNVTATAANYTVNVASSAPKAVVAISNSTLNGLCTVNVASAEAEVTIADSTINCNDNNTTAGEAYAALGLNKDAVGGSIVATNTIVNVTEGSDSVKGRNGAENGVVTINGSTEDVEVMVAAITYEGSDYYHAFATLESAIEFAKAGDTITLIRDIELTEGVTVPADAVITIDLNGKTVVYNSTTQGEAMITNKGTLTINDSVGTGVINYNYTGAADPSYGKGNYTISNGGTLTVNGGKITIANLSGHAKYPIDNNSTSGDAILVINGGHLYNYNTAAIRQFCNSTTYKNSVTINGGLIEGYSAIWMQNPGKNTVNGSLTITGGEIRSTAKAYVNGTSELKDVASKLYCTIDGEGGAWSEDSAVSITGGTFNENVYLAEEAPATITIGEAAIFNGRLELPKEYVAQIGEVKYETLVEALEAAKSGETVQLIADVAKVNDARVTLMVYEGVTLDLNGYDLEADYVVAFNGGQIIDSAVTRIGRDNGETGVLYVKEGNLILNANNPMMPVYNGSDGYLFATYLNRLIKETGETEGSIKLVINAAPTMNVLEYMKDGVSDNDIKVVLRLSWQTENGIESKDVVFSDENLIVVYESNKGTQGSYGKNLGVKITGYEGLESLEATLMVISGTHTELVLNKVDIT